MGQGEGANQPTKGLCAPTPFPTLLGEVGRLHLAWEASLQHLPGLPKHLSVMLVITRYLRNTPGLQNPSFNISIFTSGPFRNSS